MTTQGIAAILIVAAASLAQGLIGYNCGRQTLNVSVFTTIDESPCTYEDEDLTKEKTIQLLQLNEYTNIRVTQCRVEIDRTIYHCGMHSHVSIVQNGWEQYLLTTPKTVCEDFTNTGTIYLIQGVMMTGIKPNSTSSRGVTLAGSLQSDGTCAGTTYSDPFGTWTSTVVQATIKITITNYTSSINLKTNEIILRSRQGCTLQTGSCLDPKDGYTYWDNVPNDFCNFHSYSVLYEGKATEAQAKDHPTIYTVATNEFTFAQKHHCADTR